MEFPSRNNESRIHGFFLMFLLFSGIKVLALIPSESDGFWFGGKTALAKTIFIEAFLDPVCPDSRDSWPPLKKVLHEYGSKITLIVHTFPLPYHDNAFATSRALHIINKVNASATYHLLEAFFDDQEEFYGKATSNLSKQAVERKIVKFATKELGTSYESELTSGFSNSKTDVATRIAFKYGGLRGVYGTPFFFINGFPLPDVGTALDYNGWKKLIDRLLRSKDGYIDHESPLHFLL